MDTHDILHRYGEHTVGIGIAQVLLMGERQFRQIGYTFNIFGFNADFVHAAAVEGDVVVNLLYLTR